MNLPDIVQDAIGLAMLEELDGIIERANDANADFPGVSDVLKECNRDAKNVPPGRPGECLHVRLDSPSICLGQYQRHWASPPVSGVVVLGHEKIGLSREADHFICKMVLIYPGRNGIKRFLLVRRPQYAYVLVILIPVIDHERAYERSSSLEEPFAFLLRRHTTILAISNVNEL